MESRGSSGNRSSSELTCHFGNRSPRVTGYPPRPSEALSTYTILPPGKTHVDKFVFGIYLGTIMVGCIDFRNRLAGFTSLAGRSLSAGIRFSSIQGAGITGQEVATNDRLSEELIDDASARTLWHGRRALDLRRCAAGRPCHNATRSLVPTTIVTSNAAGHLVRHAAN